MGTVNNFSENLYACIVTKNETTHRQKGRQFDSPTEVGIARQSRYSLTDLMVSLGKKGSKQFPLTNGGQGINQSTSENGLGQLGNTQDNLLKITFDPLLNDLSEVDMGYCEINTRQWKSSSGKGLAIFDEKSGKITRYSLNNYILPSDIDRNTQSVVWQEVSAQQKPISRLFAGQDKGRMRKKNRRLLDF